MLPEFLFSFVNHFMYIQRRINKGNKRRKSILDGAEGIHAFQESTEYGYLYENVFK
jgi:hypothetical protein